MKAQERNKLKDLEQAFARDKNRFLTEWGEFLRYPSISTDPSRHGDCLQCAEWLSGHLTGIGLESRLLQTSGKPVVFAEHSGSPGKPTIMFYGHYDVQPVDPIEEWDTPPFEPSLRGDRLYARGAVDNKGQIFYVIKALETLLGENNLDCSVKIVVEGEEESGSEGIAGALAEWKQRLGADILAVTDVHTVQSGAPTLIMGLRGIVHLTAKLSGPRHDLHSGMHGGKAPNPAREMAVLAASLHDDNGAIAVPGYYENVLSPTPDERRAANAGGADEKAYAEETGVPPSAGEKDFTPAERTGFRPSIDVNGIHAGYGGSGVKTIIPATALVKITSRLVPGQSPGKCLKAIEEHLRGRVPDGLHLNISEKGSAGGALKLDPSSPLARKARDILNRLSKTETVLLWEGASIPIIAALADISGAAPLIAGFGRESNNPHAPNEWFSLDQFKRGYLYAASLLSEPSLAECVKK
ncbi:MAG: M20/M25/M40 family metallo-hydrolase [Kiritimatiellia bacterium]